MINQFKSSLLNKLDAAIISGVTQTVAVTPGTIVNLEEGTMRDILNGFESTFTASNTIRIVSV